MHELGSLDDEDQEPPNFLIIASALFVLFVSLDALKRGIVGKHEIYKKLIAGKCEDNKKL